MSTIAIIGAGLGQATARRVGREGFSVALVSRTQDDVDRLGADLTADGITRGYPADARHPQVLRGVLDTDQGALRSIVGETP